MSQGGQDFVIKSLRALLPNREAPTPASIFVSQGKIKKIVEGDISVDGLSVVDGGELVLMAGIVDTHAHINEPGRTEWEGFQTATRAAAAGGITTVIDMPLNSIPPTTTRVNLETKARAAQSQCFIDYGFWGGLIPGNASELQGLVDGGVMGAKAFLIESGVPEFPMVGEKDLREGMEVLHEAGLPLIVHAELGHESDGHDETSGRSYKSYLDSRPQRWEVDAIRMIIKLMDETGCRCHIVHLSAADALDDIRKAKKAGLPLTVETCPHYLTFAADEIADGATLFKCAPPIREKENRERLWQGLKDSTIDMIVSDHSPCTPQLKKLEKGDFFQAWGGIASIQFSLPAVWSEMKRRGLPLSSLTRWMSQNPARLIGFEGRKGSIAVGFDADLTLWNPEEEFVLNSSMVYHKHNLTPYSDKKLFGVVEKTFVRGNCVYDGKEFLGGPWGTRLVRPPKIV